MRPTSNILPGFRWLVAALVAWVGWSGPSAIAQPAPFCTLTGPAAVLLLDLFEPSVPVLVAGVDDNPRPILLARDPEEAALLPGDLFSTGLVEDCDLNGGDTCCNQTIGEMVVGTSYQIEPDKNEVGSLLMGEKCESPTARDRPGVKFFAVPEFASRELNAQCGVNHCFMEMSDKDGNPLVLVNAPSKDHPIYAWCRMLQAGAGGTLPSLARASVQGGRGGLRSSIMRQATLRPNSSIIPAKHVKDPPPPPRCQTGDPDHCNTGSEISYKRCQPDVRHWYKYNDDDEEWCQLTSKCTC